MHFAKIENAERVTGRDLSFQSCAIEILDLNYMLRRVDSYLGRLCMIWLMVL